MVERFEKIKGLTQSERSLFFNLRGKWRRFSGQFHYDDNRLADEIDVTKRTINRSMKTLIEKQFVRCQRGKFKGRQSHYTYVRDGKMSPFDWAKSDKMFQEGDKMSTEERQNVTPTNNTIDFTNAKHFSLPEPFFKEVFNEFSKDKIATKEHLRSYNYTETQIEEAFRKYAK